MKFTFFSCRQIHFASKQFEKKIDNSVTLTKKIYKSLKVPNRTVNGVKSYVRFKEIWPLETGFS